MPMHDEACGQLGVKIGALGWQQDAAAGIPLDLRDRVWRNQQRHLGVSRFDGRDGLPDLSNRLDDRVADQALHRKAAWQLESFKSAAARDYDGTPETGRRGRKVKRNIFDRLCGRQLKTGSFEDETMRRQAAQSAAAELDSGEVPTGCETMVTIGEEERLRIQSGLQIADAFGVSYRPNLMQTAESVSRLDCGGLHRFQQRAEQAFRIVAPKPEAAWIAFSRLQHRGARGDTLWRSLLMRENFGFGSIEHAGHSFAKRIAAVTRETKTLAIDIEGGFRILKQARMAERARHLFARHIKHGSGRAKSSKGQDDRHSKDPISVTGTIA